MELILEFLAGLQPAYLASERASAHYFFLFSKARIPVRCPAMELFVKSQPEILRRGSRNLLFGRFECVASKDQFILYAGSGPH